MEFIWSEIRRRKEHKSKETFQQPVIKLGGGWMLLC
jgi:hypothetical protein